MGFSSMDDLVNEITNNGKFYRADWMKTTGAAAYTAGHWYDLSQIAGLPVANTYAGTALNAQVPDEASSWTLYHGGNVSSDTKHLLNMAAMTAVATGVPGALMLVDYCLYYPGIDTRVTTSQTLVNTNTLTRYTDGKGLRAFMPYTTVTGTPAATPVLTMSYTRDNTGGTDTGRSLGAVTNFSAGSAALTIIPKIGHSGVAANNYGPFLPLAGGDAGIRSVQSVQFTTAHTGTSILAALVLCKPLAFIPLTTVSVAAERDLVNQLPSLPQIRDGAALNWLYFAGAATATSSNFYGSLEFGWG